MDESKPNSPNQHLPGAVQPFGFWLASLFAVLLLLASYSNHFDNSFHFDDSHVIQNNLYIRSLENIPKFFIDANTFSTHPTNATYRPLLSLTFALDYWVADSLDPFQFHVTQFVLLVLLGIGLVCVFLAIMNLSAPHRGNPYWVLFAALLFCIHTANTETVNYISSRSDLLSTLGIVGAFLIYVYLPNWRKHHLYLLPMCLGALAKPPAVLFAPLLFLFIVFFEFQLPFSDLFKPHSWPKVKTAIWRSAPAFAAGVILFWFVEAMNPTGQNYGGNIGRVQYLISQPFVWLHYVRLFVLPLGLTADTDWEVLPDWYDTRFFAGMIFIILMLMILWKTSRTKTLRPIAFGIAWFSIGLLPTSSIFPLTEVANEHRIFLPYIGLSLAVVWSFAMLTNRWLEFATRNRRLVLSVSGTLVIVLLSGHALGTYERNKVWQSEETLWHDVTQKSPRNGRGLMNYGLTQMSQGKYTEAKALFERAKFYNPHYAVLEINLAIVNNALGEKGVAEGHFTQALALRPNYEAGHFFYARWLVEQGRSNEALSHLKQTLAISPGYIEARTLLMDLLYAKGLHAELTALVQETLAIYPAEPTALAYSRDTIPIQVTPKTAKAFFTRGMVFTNQGNHVSAATLYRQSLKLDPESGDTLNNLGWTLGKLGFYEEAAPFLEKSIRLQPDYTLARNNLNWVRGQLNGK